jgi:hypothetical protein
MEVNKESLLRSVSLGLSASTWGASVPWMMPSRSERGKDLQMSLPLLRTFSVWDVSSL